MQWPYGDDVVAGGDVAADPGDVAIAELAIAELAIAPRELARCQR